MAKFTSGNGRPPGSGSKPGQKYGKTVAREEAVVALRRETNEIMKRYAGSGMTAEEIMEDMDFEPLVYAALMVQQNALKPSDTIKLLDMLVGVKHARKKAVETTGETITRIEVVMPGMVGYEDDYIEVEAKPLIEYDDVSLVEHSEDDPQDDAS